MIRCLLTVWAAFGILLGTARAVENPIAKGLITEGVQLTSGATIKLPAPWMADGLDAAAQQAVIRKVAARYPFDLFIRKSVVSPFVLNMESINDAKGSRTGQRVDVAFVAHGTLKAIREKDLLGQLLSMSKGKSRGLETITRALDEKELAERGLSVKSSPELEESFVRFSIPIIEKVQLSGINREMTVYEDSSIVAAQIMDERFAKDPKYPNQWQPIVRNPGGQYVLGEAQPYSGNGQYVKVTQLVDAAGKPTGALFIEAHMVFDEPRGWFGGANLLRSKLPMAVQDNVRDFRRLLQMHSEGG